MCVCVYVCVTRGLNTRGGAQVWQVVLMSREDTRVCWVVLIKVDGYW